MNNHDTMIENVRYWTKRLNETADTFTPLRRKFRDVTINLTPQEIRRLVELTAEMQIAADHLARDLAEYDAFVANKPVSRKRFRIRRKK